MKKRLLELLANKEERKKQLGKSADTTESVAELRSINSELEALNAEIAELRSMVDALPDEKGTDPEQLDPPEQRNAPQGQMNVLGTYGIGSGNGNESRSADPYDTPEYRQAFMQYVTKGTKSEVLEFRADATTGTGDIGVVIPTTVLNTIVEKMKDYGRIWARVTKTGLKGGVEIPLSNAKPKATWVAAGTMSDKQKKEVKGKITFSYHKLQCRVAVELVADTVAMPVFEQSVADNSYEAMIIALEEGILNGSGTGEPLGITKDTNIPAERIVDVTSAEYGKYNTWTDLYAKIPRSYRNGAVLIMADADWNKYIVGMIDDVGQPVARVNYGMDGIQTERLLGKEVIPIEDYLPSIDDAEIGDIVGVLVKLSDYMVNSNMQLFYKRYFNDDTDEWISKSTLICDGKLADRNGVVLIRKGA
ncbi:phage major capsid protein [Lysinibacillus irui]|uniref:Phage major capsid protein n=1 Tax=Lysinibacillus irui TaxID=2998077 RepID=A0ABU5NQS5_9BACI|nr:phage major capsid protein [Lysinibacillus irui]MEA0556072.1 phage major capsid protein [Lysinibacillus irui]MEA0978326.1 phage major capsid protein [Lysinibacillus irui]MEA1044480.1 phage major capsid protein [Lysinibacillus irui]